MLSVSDTGLGDLIQEDINTTAVVQMVVLSDHFQEVLTEFS